MLTLQIENDVIESVFKNEFHSNKEKFIAFIETSFKKLQKEKSFEDDLSYLAKEVQKGIDSPLSSKKFTEIFQELRKKYA